MTEEFIIGAVAGFCVSLPVAIVLHFVWRLIHNVDEIGGR